MKLRKFALAALACIFILPLPAAGYPEVRSTVPLAQDQAKDEIQTDMDSLTLLYRYVDSLYYEDVDKNAVKEAMVNGMISALGDKYSYYVPAEEKDEYLEEAEGKYVGIGIYLSKPDPSKIDPEDPSTYMVTIDSPFKGSPAARAGLKTGDMISDIDGESVREWTVTECSKAVRGVEGTDVTLTVHRGDQVFDVTLTRAVIDTPVVEHTMLPGGIGYISISQYIDSTDTQLLEAVRDLKNQGLSYLIIDERYNHGGNIDVCLKCADIFLPAGKTIVTLEGRKGTGTMQKFVSAGTLQIAQNIPMVILINESTASSAEIFAAAMRDNNRAVLVGTKSFGKGIFQQVFPFGDGYVQITTGHYYTPSGVCIHGTGLEPDVAVEDMKVSDEQLPAWRTLLDKDADTSFVKANPEMTDENIQRFVDQYKESGVDPLILQAYITYAYERQKPREEIPLVHPQFDPPLQTAIDYIKSGQ